MGDAQTGARSAAGAGNYRFTGTGIFCIIRFIYFHFGNNYAVVPFRLYFFVARAIGRVR
jgi:hypothetical protein